MPQRHLVAKELGHLFSVFSHPDRIRIIEELRDGERDVNALQTALDVTHSRTSQNLAILRANRLVAERREGRHVFYRLVNPDIARWVLEGLRFIEEDPAQAERRRTAIQEVRQLWRPEPDGSAS
ncbi:metalloregulator ArsR/SmtB family transcription factor [Luteitalea sp.]|uniref:ArsR/SmtB family transcription factor n=1 Tax=Luteitalea sp. TaxID=2004800 RepID=UPI0025B7F6E3|nr:metalloregulator ArsR/SmtB family transcription factor [Luteitalea sp.]